jgi:hypothetical protein
MKMLSTCGKKRPHSGETFTICSWVVAKWDLQQYVIKFVSYLQQVCGFLRVPRLPPPIKTDRHDITEILLNIFNEVQ